MTKLECVQNYNIKECLEAWIALGRNTITESTSYFAENMIYKVSTATDNCLRNALLFCRKELIIKPGSSINWNDWNSDQWVLGQVLSSKEKSDTPIELQIKSIDESGEETIKESYQLNTIEKESTREIVYQNFISPYFVLLLPGEYVDKAEEEEIDTLLLVKEVNDLSVLSDEAFEKLCNMKSINTFCVRNDKIDPNFIPFKAERFQLVDDKVHISDADYKNCLKCLGYPFITEEELEYTRDEIINLAIKPALEEYFHWIPFERTEEIAVTGSVQEIPVPDDAYDVLGISVQQRGTHGSGNITNTLLRYFDEAAYGSYNYSGMNGTYRGTLAPHTITTPVENYISSRALAQATVNLNTRVHFEKVRERDELTGEDKRLVRVYSNKQGAFNIHWAIHSLDFDDVEYQQRQNVFKYCQAEIKELFGNLRRQAKSDIPGAVDYSSWITEAEEAKKDVVADWKQLVKASGIIRGSL